VILPLPLYYKCLAPTEKGAIQLAYESIVPPYVFVIPKQPIDDYYAAAPDNFDLRQFWWQNMFRFGVTEVEIVPGVTVEVYTDGMGFITQWQIWHATHDDWPDDPCRMFDYSEV
jgi:hypothetical protein